MPRSPSDDLEFGPEVVPHLREAVYDLSWLRTRGYSERAAVTLVGDRFQLTARQRQAVQRGACSDVEREARWVRRRRDVNGCRVAVDGFNALISLEQAFDGGPLFRGRDGVLRDVAGRGGAWQRHGRTGDAIMALRGALAGASEVVWLLDAPVKNSGRLAQILRRTGVRQVEVVASPDRLLVGFDGVIVSGDGPLLSRCQAWFPAVDEALPGGAWVVDLGGGGLSG